MEKTNIRISDVNLVWNLYSKLGNRTWSSFRDFLISNYDNCFLDGENDVEVRSNKGKIYSALALTSKKLIKR